MNRKWTISEIEYLENEWGSQSIPAIAKAYIETKRELFKRNVNLKKNKNIAKCNTELGNYTSNNSKRLKNLTYDPKRIKEIEELEAKYENALLAW